MSRKMRKKIAGLLLAASLALNIVGCGKSGGGDAVGLSGAQGDRSSLAISSLGGDGVDSPGEQGNEDIDDVPGAMDFSDASGDSGSAGRNQVQEDFVIVPLPAISKDAFGNGFYDTYILNVLEPEVEAGPEVSCDEDGLLTSVKVSLGTESDEDSESWLTIEYEKENGLVTACKVSANIYSILVYEYGNKTGDASSANNYLMKNMPLEFVFDSPMEPDPETLIDDIRRKIVWSGGTSWADFVFPDAFQYLCDIYLEKLSSGEIGGMDDSAEMNEPEISWDVDGLLTGVKVGFATESNEASESWIAMEYKKEEGLVTACEISADMYSFFMYEYGCDEETAKEWNDELTGKMPLKIVFDEPVNLEELEAVVEWTIYMLRESAESDADYGFLEAIDYSYSLYLDKLYSGEIGSAAGNATGNGVGYEVMVGGSGTREFKGRVNAAELPGSYFFEYGGGVPMGEAKITNDPGWSIDMSVSHEDVICQIETEQDSNGNITLVHLYNDYAIYDEVFTYDSAGRMTRRDHYEYPKGQNREAVGALWYCEYSYDGQGQLVGARELSTQDNGVNTEITYYYDDMGRMAGQEVHTSYFGNDFMTMQQIYDSVVQSYDYDASGKVDTVTVTVNWAQTVIQPEWTEPTTVIYLSER